MLKKDLSFLRCPYCGFSFHLHLVVKGTTNAIEYGTVYCRCDEFPIIHSILYLYKKRHKEIVRFLQSGNTFMALQYALPRKFVRFIITPSFVHWFGLTGVQHIIGIFHNLTYYIHRDQESESLLIFFPYSFWADRSRGKRCVWLDVGSGIKNYYHEIRNINPAIRIIALEQSFLNIFLSRCIEKKNANICYVCADAAAGLFVQSHSLDVLTCHDAFPFMAQQKAIIRYFCAMVKKTGMLSIASIPEHQYLPFWSSVYPLYRSVLRTFFPSKPTFVNEATLLSMVSDEKIDLQKATTHDRDQVFRYMCLWPSIVGKKLYKNYIPKSLTSGKRAPWTSGPKVWGNKVY